jgi:signal peptide peptidase SppA
MRNDYAHVLGFAVSQPWAIEEAMLPVIAGILARHVAGQDSQAAIAAAVTNRSKLPQPKTGSVAVIPIHGVIAPRMNLMSEMSGGTTFEKLTGQVREAVSNPAIRTIVLDIDSPGGSVAGATEFARELMAARAKKPIISQIQYVGGSAAYWAAAATTEIVAAPSSSLGSIGVFSIHGDLSEALKAAGVKRTYIRAGEGKAAANPDEPLSDESRARLQASIDAAYLTFIGDVAKGRANNGAGTTVTADKVRTDWKAHTYSATDALAIGMIDRIATLDETLARLLTASGDPNDQRAALELLAPHGTDQEQPAQAATSQDPQVWLNLQESVFSLEISSLTSQRKPS